mmetsp:Transcript_79058/g.157950  ORF Transcript_79058/g.157950 Transcript_79058/m.157950 type:complete len:167 (+) Transcript_79058:135-635(+)
MNLSEIRAGAKLRRTAKEEDIPVETLIQRRGFDLNAGASDISKYQKYVQAFNLERWLEALSGFTFPTVMVDISPSEARELATSFETFKKEGLGSSVDAPASLSDSLQRALAAVDSGFGVFVKTSSRSAKDFADPGELRLEFRARLDNLTEEAGPDAASAVEAGENL